MGSMALHLTALFGLGLLAASCMAAIGDPPEARQRYCPLCDSSVFSYCTEKLLHDACCCNNRQDPSQLPYQCYYADCSFLHAKSCNDHRAISRCCCDKLFFQRQK
ncbi:uncharacterized protein [Anabrus simplex]|uniref:uncharacterized protein isoform X3 n=1 Tax=Anabrus simplex TaxID=316456 RepID=UPI0034DD2155